MLTHHAYIYETSDTSAETLVQVLRESEGYDAHSPDVVVRSYEKFGIGESRALRELASLRTSSGRALVVVKAVSMTMEAQQALLKLFEEPQAGAVFVLMVPRGTILPTLRSRCLPLEVEREKSKGKSESGAKNAEAFLALGYKERSAEVARIVKESEGNRTAAGTFLDGLERALHNRLGTAASPDPSVVEALRDIQALRPYLSDRSPSLKMIFEHLAAALPKL